MQQIISKAKTFAVGSRLSLLLGFLLIGAGYVQAQFIPPAGAPPTCTVGTAGCEIPLHTGPGAQTKTGSITVQNPGDPNVGTRLGADGRIHASSTIWSYSGIFGADSPTILANTAKVIPIGTSAVNGAITKGAAFEVQTAADGGVGGNKAEGLLPPRVNNDTVRDAITTALTGTCDSGQKKNANGLIVYNTSASKLQQWKCTSGDNGTWEDIGGAPASGSSTYDGPWFRAEYTGGYTANSDNPNTVLIFNSEVSDVDPAGASYGYSPTTGVYRPSVSGVYVFDLGVYLSGSRNYGARIALQRIRAGVITNIAYGSYVAHSNNAYPAGQTSISTVVSVDASAGDTFRVVSYGPGDTGYYGLSGAYGSNPNVTSTYFTGYRLPSAPVTLQSTTQTVITPPNAVMYFDQATCPPDWTEFTEARGMYIVGLPLGGTLKGTPNGSFTALSNRENRPVGQHRHFYTAVDDNPGGSHGSLKRYNRNGGNDATTYSGQIDADGGGVAGTNAPYVQLLACKKT